MADAYDDERTRVERLLWRAGFGPRPGEVAEWVARGHEALIDALLAPTGDELHPEPAPRAGDDPLDPMNMGGHEILWVLDRAVRTAQPLAERMALNLHDHFAVANASVGDNGLMLDYYATIRRHALGSFRELAREMTLDPAMRLFLDLSGSSKESPNENYARELLELFTLGANNGYTETDIREAARALTGFWWDYDERRGGFDREAHDTGVKGVLGRAGRLDWRDVVDAAIDHEAHAPYLCRRLWEYLSPSPCPEELLQAMVAEYRRTDTRIAPVLGIALRHEAFFAGPGEPDMVKPPVVLVAGMLRGLGAGVASGDWTWLLAGMGQQPLEPPNVAGWPSGGAWLSTGTMLFRFRAAALALAGVELPAATGADEDVPAIRDRVGFPWASEATLRRLASVASDPLLPRPQRRILIAQALLAGPDAQVC